MSSATDAASGASSFWNCLTAQVSVCPVRSDSRSVRYLAIVATVGGGCIVVCILRASSKMPGGMWSRVGPHAALASVVVSIVWLCLAMTESSQPLCVMCVSVCSNQNVNGQTVPW